MPAVLAGAIGFSAVSSIAGGINGMVASNGEAALQRQQAEIAGRQAQDNATLETFNQKTAIGRQQISFLANGVSLEGSPSLVVKQSEDYGQMQVNSILRQGAATSALLKAQATQTQNQGRAALLAGIAKGAGTAAEGGYTLYKAGAFDAPLSPNGVASIPGKTVTVT